MHRDLQPEAVLVDEISREDGARGGDLRWVWTRRPRRRKTRTKTPKNTGRRWQWSDEDETTSRYGGLWHFDRKIRIRRPNPNAFRPCSDQRGSRGVKRGVPALQIEGPRYKARGALAKLEDFNVRSRKSHRVNDGLIMILVLGVNDPRLLGHYFFLRQEVVLYKF